MGSHRLGLGGLLAGLAFAACSVSDAGLGPTHDGGSDGIVGPTICMTGTIDRANWPAAAGETSCTRSCGPDDLGVRTCGQTDVATCQRESASCVCLVSPCAKCADCAFLVLPSCYVPTNAAAPPTCPASVINGGDCSPVCGKTLCIEADGKTGCVCNAQGKYACALWSGGNWK